LRKEFIRAPLYLANGRLTLACYGEQIIRRDG